MIKNILFDLDGTLLPMDQEKFTHSYFKRLAAKIAPLGYEPEKLVKGIWQATYAVIKNNGSLTNEEMFWQQFAVIFGERVLEDKPVFDEYYRVEFQNVKDDCGFNSAAAETVKKLKSAGYRIVLATNPIFPAVATESRIRWAGLEPEDFELYTTYENSHYCKPNPLYYREILDKLDLNADESLMVGNDVEEDMVAKELGMSVFLLKDCLINKNEKDISAFPQGGFAELCEYIKKASL